MANEKIKYSNGCSPQELDSTGARWYQDSDVGTKLSGNANVAMSGGSLAYVSSKTITSAETTLTAKDPSINRRWASAVPKRVARSIPLMLSVFSILLIFNINFVLYFTLRIRN